MQTPEKVSLIGGSILLSSGLILGLHSSASSILPKISHPIYEITASDKQKQQDAHNDWWNGLSNFDKEYVSAQQQGWRTGQWGTSKYYIDNQNILYVGNGQVQGNLSDLLGKQSNDIKDVRFDNNAQHSTDSTMNANDLQKQAHDKWWNGLSDFDKGYNTAQQNGWKIGTWGTSKYYINNQNVLYVGNGQVQGNLADLLGNESNDIKDVKFDNNAQHSSDNLMNANDVNHKKQQQAFENSFEGKYQQAQHDHWQTGTWGTSKFYVDNQNTMHVGSGEPNSSNGDMSSSYINVVDYNKIKAISLDEPVQAPRNSDFLFSSYDPSHGTPGYADLQHIYNLNNLNTSNTVIMDGMFFDDYYLQDLDFSSFDTSNLSSVAGVGTMFENDSNISRITLGKNTKFNGAFNGYLNGTYKNNDQTMIFDGNAHPGTWIKQ